MTNHAVPETLTEFGDELDAHHGRAVGFAAAVRALAATRAQIKVVDTRRAAVFAMLTERCDRGDQMVGGGVMLARTKPTPMVTKRVVPSAVAKKQRPELWERCKVAANLVQAAPPASERGAYERDAMAAVPFVHVPGERAPLADVVEAYQACKTPAELRECEEYLVARLRVIAADCGWDGLPYVFRDGWTAGLKRMQYSSDELRRIAPEVFEALAVEKTTGGSSQVYVTTVGIDDGEPEEGL